MTSSPTNSSYSTSSDTDRFNVRYHGTIQTPLYGMANMQLSPIKVTFERLDPDGTPLKTNDAHITGLVVRIGLASEDGTLDYDLTSSRERLLLGQVSQAPRLIDGKLVTTFLVKVRSPGRFRFRVQLFNIYPSTMQLPNAASQPMEMTSEALFNGVSDPVLIYTTESINLGE